MRIHRLFSNNCVGVLLDDGAEAVLIGRGIGYARRKGDRVDPTQVEKRFLLEPEDVSRGLRNVLVALPYDVVALTAEVVRRLSARHGITVTAPVEIGLADHLATAIDRIRSGTPLANNLLFETKASYRSEFTVALDVLEWVEELSGYELPLDEAGFIAMHLVNAGLTGSMTETLRTTGILNGAMEIVRTSLASALSTDSPHYARFLTHLKFVLQRLSDHTQLTGGHASVYDDLRLNEPEAFDCATHVADYLGEQYGVRVSEEEVLYLLLHVARLRGAARTSADPRGDQR